jgi:hypothetical protein
VEDALLTLSYHGVIDESLQDLPRISGFLFREWFQRNVQLENSAATGLPDGPARIVPSPADNRRAFVVHGRNERIRAALFTFLVTVGLKPLEWAAVVEATQNQAPPS